MSIIKLIEAISTNKYNYSLTIKCTYKIQQDWLFYNSVFNSIIDQSYQYEHT